MLQELSRLSETAWTRFQWLGLTAVGAFVFSRIAIYLVQRYLVAGKLILRDFSLKKHFSGSIFFFLWSATLKVSLQLQGFKTLTEQRVETLLDVIVILTASWSLTRFFVLLRLMFVAKLDISTPNNLRQRKIRTQIQFVEKVILMFVWVVAVSLVLMSFEGVRKIGSSLIASAGLAGVILGFAAQRSLANLLAGFQIAFTQPIRIDDVVIVEEEWGRIEEITLTYVVVRIWDKRALVVPITYFIEKPFQNWTRASAELLGTVFLHLDYAMPIDELRAEFMAILKSSLLWDGNIAAVQITDTTEKTMEVRFLMGARNSSETFELRCEVREKLLRFIQRTHAEHLPKNRMKVG